MPQKYKKNQNSRFFIIKIAFTGPTSQGDRCFAEKFPVEEMRQHI